MGLSIEDPKLLSIASTRFQLFGATVATVPYSKPPDLIVTDSMLPIIADNGPRTLSVHDIPWLFWPERKLLTLTEPTAAAIVVADCSCKHRPNFRLSPKVPHLHFGAVPRGYTTTPLAPIQEPRPDNEASVQCAREEFSLDGNPPDQSYCELCLIAFSEAREHRRSKGHQRKITSGIFGRLDEVSAQLAAMNRLCLDEVGHLD
jgi:hypothetical protein